MFTCLMQRCAFHFVWSILITIPYQISVPILFQFKICIFFLIVVLFKTFVTQARGADDYTGTECSYGYDSLDSIGWEALSLGQCITWTGRGMDLAQVCTGIDRLGRKLLDLLLSLADYSGVELRSRANLELHHKTEDILNPI